MSKFTKALEQAERDRAHRAPSASVPSPAPALAREAPKHRPTSPDLEATTEIEATDIDETLQSLHEIGGLAAERYRALRTCVEEANVSKGPFVVAITSPAARDGKTVTSINLAGSFAQSADARVLLVDLDFRRGSIPAKLGIHEQLGRGFADAIRDPEISLAHVVHRLPKFNLSFVPSGRAGAAPYELLRSPRIVELLDEAKRHFDYIILDTPPLVPVADGRLIERFVDRVIVVVAASRTPRKLLEESLRLLTPEKLLGFVFNDASAEGSSYYSGYEYVSSAPARPQGWVDRIASRWRR